MKISAVLLAMLLPASVAAPADEPPLVREFFLSEAPWTPSRGDLQVRGRFRHARSDSAVGAQGEFGVSDRVAIDLTWDRTLPDVGDGESEVEIGGRWAVRPDPDHFALSLGASLAQLDEDGTFTFQASAGQTLGAQGAVVADLILPLEDGADATVHAGYVHRLGSSLRLLGEGELSLGHPRTVSLAPGLVWKPSEAVELGGAVVFPLRDGLDTSVVAQATFVF